MPDDTILQWSNSEACAYLVGRWRHESVEELFSWALRIGRSCEAMPDPAAKLRGSRSTALPPWLDSYVCRLRRIRRVFTLRVQLGSESVRNRLSPYEEDVAPYRRHEERAWENLRLSLGPAESRCLVLGEKLSDPFPADSPNFPIHARDIKDAAHLARVPRSWLQDVDWASQQALTVEGRTALYLHQEISRCLSALNARLNQQLNAPFGPRIADEKTGKAKKPGRRKEYVEEEDANLASKWQSAKTAGNAITHRQFIRMRNLDISEKELRKALDRHRKRMQSRRN